MTNPFAWSPGPTFERKGRWISLLEWDHGVRDDDYITIIDMEAHVWVTDEDEARSQLASDMHPPRQHGR